MKEIKITIDDRTYRDFISYAGGKGKAPIMLKEWIYSYVKTNNDKDLEILENNRIKREAFNKSL